MSKPVVCCLSELFSYNLYFLSCENGLSECHLHVHFHGCGMVRLLVMVMMMIMMMVVVSGPGLAGGRVHTEVGLPASSRG